MIKIIKLILLLILMNSSLLKINAQQVNSKQVVQNGVVREINSGNTGVPSVQIIYEGATAQDTDGAGKFKLVFKELLNPGDDVYLQNIRKVGYEVVNLTELQTIQLTSNDSFPKPILLAKSGVIDKYRAEWSGASTKALTKSYRDKILVLERLLDEAKITEEEKNKQQKELREQLQFQQKQINDIADRFARTNFDDEPQEYTKALELFKEGKVDSTIIILEKINVEERIAVGISEENKAKKYIEENLKIAHDLANFYNLNFDENKAIKQYERIYKIDSTNLSILNEVAKFYNSRHLYQKAIYIYKKIINHKDINLLNKANSQVYISELYMVIGRVNQAKQFLNKAIEIYQILIKESPNQAFLYNLALSYESLGLIEIRTGNLENSIKQFDKSKTIFKWLNEKFPNEIEYKENTGSVLQYVGLGKLQYGDYDAALEDFIEMNKTYSELNKLVPDNVDYSNGLAISFQFLADLNMKTGNLDKSLSYAERYNEIQLNLFNRFNNEVYYKNGVSISFQLLGDISKKKNIEQAHKYYEKGIIFSKELSKDFPQNLDFKYRLSNYLRSIGDVYKSKDSLNKSLDYYNKSKIKYQELISVSPNNTDYMEGLSDSFSSIGDINNKMAKYKEALDNYSESMKLALDLYSNNSNNVYFKNSLISCFSNITNTLLKLEDTSLTIDLLKKFDQLKLGFNSIDLLEYQLPRLKSNGQLYSYYFVLSKLLLNQDGLPLEDEISNVLNSSAWYAILSGKFEISETLLNEALNLKTDNKYIHTNLPSSILLQGNRFEEAKKLYLEWKDLPFNEQGYATYKEVFLDDIKTFEEENIISKIVKSDVEKIKKLLKE